MPSYRYMTSFMKNPKTRSKNSKFLRLDFETFFRKSMLKENTQFKMLITHK